MKTEIILKALADDVRLDIVRHLATKNESVASHDVVSSCSTALQLSQPTLSHHLAKLVAGGILSEQKRGKQKFYRLNREQLQAVGIDATKL